jgi:prolyl-tRNA synthetase
MDESMKGRKNFECGANKTNYHTINVNFGRDISNPEEFYDIKVAKEGDYYPENGEKYEVFKAAEVGNIFPLYTKFAEAFGYCYTDEKGNQKPVYMGCYGIGSSRIMGLLVEQFHDEKGIIWPMQIAPFDIHLVGLDLKNEEVKSKVQQVYQALQEKKIEVLFDDREDISAGEKFSDADLIGIPIRLVVSKRTGERIEFKKRNESEAKLLSLHELLTKR